MTRYLCTNIDENIEFWRPKYVQNDVPRILVVAGMHGDEPGGVDVVQLAMGMLFTSSLSFIPTVNPWGLANGTRLNHLGKDSNRGFDQIQTLQPAFFKYWLEILNSARDGMISIHEDTDSDDFYMYAFDETVEGMQKCARLVKHASKHFSIRPDGIYDGEIVENGVIMHSCDGSMEDRMFHDGVKNAVCIELPGKLSRTQRLRGGLNILTSYVM